MSKKYEVVLAKKTGEVEFGRVQVSSVEGPNDIILWDKLYSRTKGYEGTLIGPVITEDRGSSEGTSIFESQVSIHYAVEVAHAILALARAKGVIADREPAPIKEHVVGYVNKYRAGDFGTVFSSKDEALANSANGKASVCKVVEIKE